MPPPPQFPPSSVIYQGLVPRKIAMCPKEGGKMMEEAEELGDLPL